jgi:hypothetical protein
VKRPGIFIGNALAGLLGALVLALAVTLVVVGSGWSGYGARVEGGSYYLTHRSQRFEVTPEEYEDARWRNAVLRPAGFALVASVIVFRAMCGRRQRR